MYRKIYKNIIIVSLAILCLLPSSLFAAEDNNAKNAMDEIEKQLEPYLTAYLDNDDDVIIEFNEKKAQKDNLNPEIIKFGKDLEELSYDFKEGGIKTRVVLPYWGNYCGPGYGGKDNSKPPTDILDQGCKAHDMCYKHGGNNCACNKQLITYINRNYNKMSGIMAEKALKIKYYFQIDNKLHGC